VFVCVCVCVCVSLSLSLDVSCVCVVLVSLCRSLSLCLSVSLVHSLVHHEMLTPKRCIAVSGVFWGIYIWCGFSPPTQTRSCDAMRAMRTRLSRRTLLPQPLYTARALFPTLFCPPPLPAHTSHPIPLPYMHLNPPPQPSSSMRAVK
jgi:hypothetical protein